MRTAQYIFRSLTVALAATASLLLCLAVSCRRAPAPLPDDFGVTVLIDNPSSSDGTKAIADNEINSIAIFAFSVGSGELARYVYESGLTGKTTFPMTLKASGAIDFYAIANPAPGYFRIVDADGQPIDLRGTSAANPPKYDATGIQNWRVEINDASSRPGEAAPWYAPMTNLPIAGGINRRYTINPDDNWTIIPLELTRAVSKIEVWFRSNDQLYDYPDEYTHSRNEYPDGDYYNSSFYSLQNIKLSLPVKSSTVFNKELQTDYIEVQKEPTVAGPFSYKTETQNGFNTEGYDPENNVIPSNFYTDEYFSKIGEFYILSNLDNGGNMAGESVGSSDPEKCTKMKMEYFLSEEMGEYERQEYVPFRGYRWEWKIKETVEGSRKDKIIYLPVYDRNSIIRVWCNLNDNTDRSFTYTVVDWDETVEVNVPDFE